MKTMVRGHDVLPLNSAARNFEHLLYSREHHQDSMFEKLTKAEVMVPLVIVLLTILAIAVQYYLLTAGSTINLPTFVDLPFA
jgi:hypothetical protein